MAGQDRRRRERALAPPPLGLDLTGFPVREVLAGESLWRNHRFRPTSDGGAWYFASVPAQPGAESGRFDLRRPRGTCYLATTKEAAVRELIGPEQARLGWLPSSSFERRVLTPLEVPVGLPAANVSSNKATKFGVTAELCTTERYGITQQWARVLAEAGFGAIWHRLRFSPGKGRGLALFGEAGAPVPPWPTGGRVLPVRPIAERLGCRVVDVPSTADLVIDPG